MKIFSFLRHFRLNPAFFSIRNTFYLDKMNMEAYLFINEGSFFFITRQTRTFLQQRLLIEVNYFFNTLFCLLIFFCIFIIVELLSAPTQLYYKTPTRIFSKFCITIYIVFKSIYNLDSLMSQ